MADADEAREKRDGQQHDRSRQEAEKALLYFNPHWVFSDAVLRALEHLRTTKTNFHVLFVL